VNDLLSTTDDKELKDGIYSLNDLYLEKKLWEDKIKKYKQLIRLYNNYKK
jgi:hypothetical protein